MKNQGLFPLIREKVPELLNGYVQAREILEEIGAFIVPPDLGDQAGVLGAIALASKAAENQARQR